MDARMRKLLSHSEGIFTTGTNTPISSSPSQLHILHRCIKICLCRCIDTTQQGMDHPITYVSRLFRGSQLNWATLIKEAYTIYMSVKKLSFYINTAKIRVRSNHLPLKKLLEKNTLNSKVNNWAVELESQNITFKYITGIRNTLADTLSGLIEMDEPQPEEKGKEFGYFPFGELPPVTTQVVEEVIKCEIGNINIQHTDPIEINTDIHLPLKDDKLVKLQKSDPHIKQLRKQWKNKNLDQNTYMMENNILKRKTPHPPRRQGKQPNQQHQQKQHPKEEA